MILEAKDLTKSFKKGRVKAVRGVSFSLEKGCTLGVVGESGSGKSTLVKILMRLLDADKGEIYFKGVEIGRLKGNSLQEFRKKAQIIFQNPYLSLDPRMTVEEILREPFLLSGKKDKHFLEEKVLALLSQVELAPSVAQRFSRELSGGECQRIAIARAISRDPELLVCDEPVSSLDNLVQAQTLNLLLKLQKEKGVSFIFVTHNLRVARHMSDEVMVMKEGEVCEMGPRDAIFKNPKHSYTQLLIKQIPCQDFTLDLR